MRSGLSDDSLVTDDPQNTNSVCLFLSSASPRCMLRDWRSRTRKGGELSVLRTTLIRHVLNYPCNVISLLTPVTITASHRGNPIFISAAVGHRQSFWPQNEPAVFPLWLTTPLEKQHKLCQQNFPAPSFCFSLYSPAAYKNLRANPSCTSVGAKWV